MLKYYLFRGLVSYYGANVQQQWLQRASSANQAEKKLRKALKDSFCTIYRIELIAEGEEALKLYNEGKEA